MESMVAASDTRRLDLVLEKLYRDGGYDFRDYKRGTITRRLSRRLYATGAGTYLEYLRFLDSHPEEYQRLADDLTIKVSDFFRSRISFQQLAHLVLPELLSYKEAVGEKMIRFWSVACARGEEPYSIAILLDEFLGQRRYEFDISIQATDISQWALSRAHTGEYCLTDLKGIPESVMQNCFTCIGEYYKVRADIKQMVSFSHFNLASITRPPFTGLDCIFCCNVLIYWQKQLQERVLGMLCDVLSSPGYLVLGEVESPTSNIRRRLVCLDSRAKIYKKVA